MGAAEAPTCYDYPLCGLALLARPGRSRPPLAVGVFAGQARRAAPRPHFKDASLLLPRRRDRASRRLAPGLRETFLFIFVSTPAASTPSVCPPPRQPDRAPPAAQRNPPPAEQYTLGCCKRAAMAATLAIAHGDSATVLIAAGGGISGGCRVAAVLQCGAMSALSGTARNRGARL